MEVVAAQQQVIVLVLQDLERQPVQGPEAALRIAAATEDGRHAARIGAALAVRQFMVVAEDHHHMIE